MFKSKPLDFALDLIVIDCLKRKVEDLCAGDLAIFYSYTNFIRTSETCRFMIECRIDEARTGRFFGESYTSDELSKLESNLLYLDLKIDCKKVA